MCQRCLLWRITVFPPPNKRDEQTHLISPAAVWKRCVKRFKAPAWARWRPSSASGSGHSAETLSVQTPWSSLSSFTLCSSTAASPRHMHWTHRYVLIHLRWTSQHFTESTTQVKQELVCGLSWIVLFRWQIMWFLLLLRLYLIFPCCYFLCCLLFSCFASRVTSQALFSSLHFACLCPLWVSSRPCVPVLHCVCWVTQCAFLLCLWTF